METSGLSGTNVESAFKQVAEKHAKSLENNMQLGMPMSLGSAQGAVQMSAADDARRTQQLKETKKSGKSGCC